MSSARDPSMLVFTFFRLTRQALESDELEYEEVLTEFKPRVE